MKTELEHQAWLFDMKEQGSETISIYRDVDHRVWVMTRSGCHIAHIVDHNTRINLDQ